MFTYRCFIAVLILVIGPITSLHSMSWRAASRIKTKPYVRPKVRQSWLKRRFMATQESNPEIAAISKIDVSKINDPEEFVKERMAIEKTLANTNALVKNDQVYTALYEQQKKLHETMRAPKPWWKFWISQERYRDPQNKAYRDLSHKMLNRVQTLEQPLKDKLHEFTGRGLELELMRKVPVRDDWGNIDPGVFNVVPSKKYDAIKRNLRLDE